MKTLSVALFVLAFIFGCGRGKVEPVAVSGESVPKPKTVLDRFCADCHAPPEPSVHKADEWANVVFRMNNHRVKRAFGELSAQDYDAIVLYLSERAPK